MKNTYLIILACTLLAMACQPSKMALRKGNYDKAIDRSVKKLRRNSTKQKEILVLEEAYGKAMERDSSSVAYMKKEGRPDNWDEIMGVYRTMKARQEKVKSLPKLRVVNKDHVQLRIVDFHFKNYDEQIIQSKEKAAEYYYAHGKSLLNQGGRQNAREAYEEFTRVKELYPAYKDINNLLTDSKNKGTSRVLIQMRNETRQIIPVDLEEDLLQITSADMDRKWVDYYTRDKEGVHPDFYVMLYLRDIAVTPESVKESRFTETREVQDGWQFRYDKRGNVMKDSLGNDIKIPKIVVIGCDVIETIQQKTARISSRMEFVDAVDKSIIKSFPLTADTKFENYALVPFGNVDALKPETRKRLGGKPMPFPNELDMVYKAGEELKRLAREVMMNNERLLK